jgi:DNA-binding XRE family transcriptional regulator
MKKSIMQTEREEQGITTKAMARRIGYTRDMLYKVETGRYKANIIMLFKACAILRIPVKPTLEEFGFDTSFMEVE